jgi:hypothetical protein
VLLWAPAALAARVYEPRLSVLLEERYDDDFRLRGDETSGQLMTKVSPRIGLDVRSPTLEAESFYAVDMLMRLGSGSMGVDHRAGLEASQRLSRRLRVEVMGRVFRVTDPTSLPRESVASAMEPVFYGQLRLSATGRPSRRVDARGGYGLEGIRVLTPGQETGYVHTPFLELWLRSTRRLSLGLEYRYQAFLYGEAFSQAHGAFATLRYRLTRQTTFTARAGPVGFSGEDGARGVLPRVALELGHDAELLEVVFSAGHDLVGATGFATALWADYATLVAMRRLGARVSAYAAGSFFRNGRAPGEDAFSLGGSPRVSQGYTLRAGVELRLNRHLTLQGAVDRVAQVGAEQSAAEVDLARNVAAIRALITAW